MFRRSTPTTLGEFVRQTYSVTKPIRPETARQYEIAADLLERWAGRPVRLDELDERSVSEWLRDYSRNHAPSTVRAKKQAVMTLWRAAADEGLAAEPVARRVRRTTVPERPVEAWTKAEIERLSEAAATLPRKHPCGLRRSVWFDLAIRIAWDSGLRWGDQIRLPVSAVHPDGWVSVTQSKTGKVATFRLSQSTMMALHRSLEQAPRSLVMPWAGSHETFNAQVRRLVKRAGVRPGTWKWIRRASGTDVELQEEGAGHKHLGNTRKIFEAHYADASQLGRRPPSPRELALPGHVDALPAMPAQSRLGCTSTPPTT
jgi:integrase